MNTTPLDVAIIGGGPAGSTAATVLARKGFRVVVLERDRFPRFHIGESLLPLSMLAFERLGLSKKLASGDYLDKFGAEITTTCGAKQVRFHFRNAYHSKQPQSLQVLRSKFDHLMLEHAMESGAEVRQETVVKSIYPSTEGQPNRLIVAPVKGGIEETLEAKWVIDCSGRQSVLGSALGLKESYPDLLKFAVFAHFEGAYRPEGENGTLTRMVRGSDFWFWMIPMTQDRLSVGIVCDTAAYKARGEDPETFLNSMIAATPEVANWLKTARRVSPVHAAGDYSYRHTQLVGDGWLLAGDAAGFIDPVFSSGVFMAVHTGEQAALAVAAALKNPSRRLQLMAVYERDANRVMDIYLRFVRAWYRPEFIDIFLNPVRALQIVPAVNAVLAGDLGHEFGVRWRVELFYLAVKIQRYFALSPRLELPSVSDAPSLRADPIPNASAA